MQTLIQPSLRSMLRLEPPDIEGLWSLSAIFVRTEFCAGHGTRILARRKLPITGLFPILE
jgi:hypothetical protein